MAAGAESKYIAFLDECGDHSLKKIDTDFPLFVLATIVVDRAEYRDIILPEINRLKLRYFSHEGVNLHSREIRLEQGAFRILLNPNTRRRFMNDLTRAMARLPFSLVVAAIDKRDIPNDEERDPYEIALGLTMQRLAGFLESEGESLLPVVAEARGKREDSELRQAFSDILLKGTGEGDADRFRKFDCPMTFHSKLTNITGIQLADLCAYPCARHILNSSKSNTPFETVKSKIYRPDSGDVGWIVYP